MESHENRIQFLILWTLISAALCYTNHESIASRSVAKSVSDDGGGTPDLKFVYAIEDPETKIPCTLANMSISIVVNYTTTQHTIVRKQMEIPSNAVVKGACGTMVSEMSFVWKTSEDNQVHQNTVKFLLFNDRTNFSVFSVNVDLFLDSANFPNAAAERRSVMSGIDLGLFDAPVKDGLHKCLKQRKIKVDDNTTLIASDVSFIAFNTKKDYGQRKEIICGDDANTKVFPLRVEEKIYGAALLARMSFNVEIPYLTINNTMAKYAMPISIRDSTTYGYIYRDSIRDTFNGYIALFSVTPDAILFYQIIIYFNQDIHGVAYVSDINLYFLINKKFLPDAKYSVNRREKKHVDLFPTPSSSGIFSCSQGVTLYVDDIRFQMTDILLVMFDRTGDFSSKQVIDCNSQPKLTEKNFTYAVRKENGAAPCILANMSINMRIPYEIPRAPNTVYTNITVPTNATVNGFCDPSLSKMTLTWPAEDSQLNTMAFYLSRDLNFSVFYLETNIYRDNTSFPNIYDSDEVVKGLKDKKASDSDAHRWGVYRSNFSLGMFVGPKDDGWYNCPKRQEIIQHGGTTITISNVSLIAFNEHEDLNGKQAYDCSYDDKKNDTIQPHPSEAAFKYVVRNEDQYAACILANMTISVKVTYVTNSMSNRETTFVMPKDGVNVTGNCNCRNPELTLSWLPEGAVPNPEQPYKTRNSITLSFSGDLFYNYVSTVKVGFYLDKKNFPDALKSRYTITERQHDLFLTNTRSVYKCNRETVVELRKVELTFNDIALISFNNERNVSNFWENECRIESTGISVPIILASVFGGLLLGCLLAGIIYACKKHCTRR